MLDRRMFGNTHSFVAAGLSNLANVLRLKGDLAEAEQVYRQALAIDRERFVAPHGAIALALNSVANVRRLLGDDPGAEALFREAADQARRALGDDHVNTIAINVNLGRTLEAEGRTARPRRSSARRSARLDTARAAHQPWWVNARTGLALVLLDRRRAAEARDLLAAGRAVRGADDRRRERADERRAVGAGEDADGDGRVRPGGAAAPNGGGRVRAATEGPARIRGAGRCGTGGAAAPPRVRLTEAPRPKGRRPRDRSSGRATPAP